jgi:hypothetical protein
MSFRPKFPGRSIGLLALLCVAPASRAQETPRPAVRPRAHVYTNADLERVHPRAAETGVNSVPAVAAGDTPETAAREERRRGRGEAYWRSEAARVRERLRALEQRAAELRAQIAERASQSEVFGRRRASSGSSSIASLRASLAAVERRARLTQDDLEDRARRDGALPGWLR